jgi:uncharacterized DUF497 family protein
MRDERFEWHDRKAATNLREHHVTFELARLVFDDPMALTSWTTVRPKIDGGASA